MLDLPKGVWEWISRNGRDVARVAKALETVAHELQQIRKALQENDDREEQK